MLRNRFFGWSAVALAGIVAASWCLSLALQAGWLRHSLEVRLSTAFGRPVEVGRFEFSILGGPSLEADSITVGEDPHFGQEYFLRADQLTAALRWTALLRGRVEFDRISLSHPSLNLVRSPEGEWNVETWLPPANKPVPSSGSSSDLPERVTRIDIDAGRMNFKKGPDKLPFALVDVAGSLNLEGGGRWTLDLEAHPMRAAVVLQSSGTLRLRGTVAGTSARLQPADLHFSWEGASLADAARLAHGSDYGLRGLLDAQLSARIDPAGGDAAAGAWKIDGTVRLDGVHRWNLPARADNPAIDLKLAAAWRPGEPRLEIDRWIASATHSSLDGRATIDWSRGLEPQVDLLQSQIGFSDLLDWGRAFSSGLSEEIEISGNAGVRARLAGWPLRLEDVNIEGSGASIRNANRNLAPVLIGPLRAAWGRSSLVLAPVSVRFFSTPASRVRRGSESASVAEGVFHVDGTLGPVRPASALRDWPYRLTVAGQTDALQDLRASLAALGWQYGSNWRIEGPASLKLIAAGSLRPGSALLRGLADFHDARLSSGAMNEPVLISSATLNFSPGERNVEIAGARALGAHWKGSLQKSAASVDWTFDLSADRLQRAGLARDLGVSREGFFNRIFPFAESSRLTPEAQAAIARIEAHGHLHIDELAVDPLRFERLDATAELRDGSLTLRSLQADLLGGRVSGDFHLQLGPEPQYGFRGQIDRTDLSELAALTSLRGGFGGIASGQLELTAQGLQRQALLASLQGQGFLHIQELAVDALKLPSDLSDAGLRPASSRFRTSSLSFRVQDGSVHFDPLLLSGRQRQLEMVGDIDFNRRVSLRIRSLSQADPAVLAAEPATADDAWIVGGTLDAPQVVRQDGNSVGSEAAAAPAAAAGRR